jgi:hypothetical protein
MPHHWKGAPAPYQQINLVKVLGLETRARTMCDLASATVAVLCVQWGLAADFVRDLAAIAATAPFGLSEFCIRADLVRGSVLVAGVFFGHC